MDSLLEDIKDLCIALQQLYLASIPEILRCVKLCLPKKYSWKLAKFTDQILKQGSKVSLEYQFKAIGLVLILSSFLHDVGYVGIL